jgi:hypothetical protein
MKNTVLKSKIAGIILLYLCLLTQAYAQQLFDNPVMDGADPWLIQKGDYYFYMHTTGRNLTIWKTQNLHDL